MGCWHSPAKINLYLAVMGLRADGFHEIDSLVALLDFGDLLEVTPSPTGLDEYRCNAEDLPFGPDNLICRALDLYRCKTGFDLPVSIKLDKQIPMGAGLGGGSSNAATLLKAINALNPDPVDLQTLSQWSSEIGSDCPLFFATGIIRIRGRGERVEPFGTQFLPESDKLRIAVFHPGFEIGAGWAYTTLRNRFPSSYAEKSEVEDELGQWAQTKAPWARYHRNDLSVAVDSKYLAIPTLKAGFQREFARPLYMSGSGSACFCILDQNENGSAYIDFVKSCWGAESFSRICITC
jgi:4-diphosphocytidyl-2-C-methyl-D-erythritol kinase